VEDSVVSAFKTVATLTDADRRYLNSRRGGGEMRLMLARKVLSEGFHDQLDENTDVFALRNGLFDMRTRAFRPMTPEDRIQTHADWAYDPQQARAERPNVERFLAQIFPLECERRIVLTYMASLLSGRRKIKKFMVLTDRRAGNNGKSTVSRLFRRFLGSYAKASTKFVCKGSFDRDRDSHDAGLEPFKGKRLLLAEELKKTMTLDVAMLKQYTGGAGETAEGRKCGSGDWFKFTWQAGFLLIFNENDAPKFDATDEAFLGRMVVAPMRSRFVAVDEHGRHPELDEEYTYPMDKDVEASFDGWLPALADILLEHYDENGMDSIPPSMQEWRADIADSGNILAEWFADNLTITGNKKDTITVKELHAAYMHQRALEGEHVEGFCPFS
jgi:phage/plasmid-associated DNA primase